MKKSQIVFAVIALLIACSPEEKNLAPSVTVGVKDLSDNSVVLIGKANLGTTVASDLKVGFQYSESAGILPSNSKTVEAFNADADYNYSAEVSGLEPGTTYYFRSFVRQNSVDTFGETKSFTTTKTFVTQIKLDKTDLTLHEGESDYLSITIIPNNASDWSVTWTSSNESVVSVESWYQCGIVTAKKNGKAIIKVSSNDGSGVFASCSVSVCPAGSIDLGLSVYWATCNLCNNGFVSSPEKNGDYYAWGETESKSYYSWLSYKFGTNQSGPFSKYNTDSSFGAVDNKTTLDPEDDAAHVILGGKWRIPTNTEWQELLSNCNCTLVADYNDTGISGLLVTARNGNSIFFPAAGIQISSGLSYEDVGEYWSSSLNTLYPYWAIVMIFDSDVIKRSNNSRYSGHSVRPVTE